MPISDLIKQIKRAKGYLARRAAVTTQYESDCAVFGETFALILAQAAIDRANGIEPRFAGVFSVQQADELLSRFGVAVEREKQPENSEKLPESGFYHWHEILSIQSILAQLPKGEAAQHIQRKFLAEWRVWRKVSCIAHQRALFFAQQRADSYNNAHAPPELWQTTIYSTFFNMERSNGKAHANTAHI